LACHWVCLCHLINIKTQHEIEHEIGNLSCLSNNFSPSFALAIFYNTHTQKQSLAFDHTKVVTKQNFNQKKASSPTTQKFANTKRHNLQKKNTKKMLQNKPLPNLFGKPMKNLQTKQSFINFV
jgi:hypothetical protein